MSDITVVVPYYNEEDSISETLGLLQSQTLQPSEIVMVNSSSTDSSSEIVDEWIATKVNNSSIKFKNLHPVTNTPGGSMAAGVDVATSSHIAFMDCGLTFTVDWLAKQKTALDQDPSASWVIGGLITSGEGIVDKSAIAHTYGFNRFRPCMPSALLKKQIFESVGRLKDLRAGFDAQWMRDAIRLNEKRIINRDVVVSYLGTSFAPNLWKVFTKSVLYARPTINSGNYIAPCVYTAAATAIIPLVIYAPKLLLFGALAYIGARLALACAKSRRGCLYFMRPDRLVVLILTGAVMDFGKLTGYLRGFIDKFNTRRSN